MKYFFGLYACILKHAFLIHLGKLMMTNLLIELLIYLPDHQCYLFLCHLVLHLHFVKNTFNICSCEVLSIVLKCQHFEYNIKILLFSVIELKLFQFLFDGLLFFSFPLFQILKIKLKWFLGLFVLFKQSAFFVFGSEVGRQIIEGIYPWFLFFSHLIIFFYKESFKELEKQ